MFSALRQFMHRRMQQCACRVKSIKRIRNLLYNASNLDEFSNLFEHEKMLADATRVGTYAAAIQRHIQPGQVVVDLGTGTGLLALLAARQHPRKVIAIEHSNIIQVAREVAARNQGGCIQFVQAHSRQATLGQGEEKADWIVHEQMGDLLFNENMVANLLDLKQRMLKPSGRILPARFEVYLEPARLKQEHRVPFLWEQDVQGIDLRFLKDSPALDPFKRRSYPYRWLDAEAVEAFACEPEPLFAFDLNQITCEAEIPGSLAASRTVVHPGRVDGLCFYFRVLFDESIQFDTSPLHPNTSWGRRFFRLPVRHCEAGQRLRCRLDMPDLVQINTWSASLEG